MNTIYIFLQTLNYHGSFAGNLLKAIDQKMSQITTRTSALLNKDEKKSKEKMNTLRMEEIYSL